MDRALVTPPFEARSKSRKEDDDDNDGNEENATNRSRFSRERQTGGRANPKRRICEKIRNRDARENHRRSRDWLATREKRRREKERLLAIRVTHDARDNFARVTSSSRRAASLFIEEETRFRFFRLMWLSRGISYGKTAERRIFAHSFESFNFQEKFRVKWRIICSI